MKPRALGDVLQQNLAAADAILASLRGIKALIQLDTEVPALAQQECPTPGDRMSVARNTGECLQHCQNMAKEILKIL